MNARPILRATPASPTIEGAGVRLHRAFGFGDTDATDPFLLLDDFRGDQTADYEAGFPWHPHRGIETITYMLAGSVAHADSLGNSGEIGPGDVQWMTAGRGILHQEMPRGDAHGRLAGFQLWANLPASHKMAEPRYQDIPAARIPVASGGDGVTARIVCGSVWGVTGPVLGVTSKPTLVDVTVEPGRRLVLPLEEADQALAYIYEGEVGFGAHRAGNRTLLVFGTGGDLVADAGDAGARLLVAAGRPLREPVAWRGPIVMNTDEELRRAFAQLRDGTFLQPAG